MHKHEHQEPAPVPSHPVNTACDDWLDRALEDSFPASDPIASYSFD